jgi:predicted CXXCH cytochrome family protein
MPLSPKRLTPAAAGLITVCLALALVLALTGGTAFARQSATAKNCFGCHDDLRKKIAGKSLHAPVKDGDCTTCHNPHASESKFLLSGRVEQVCYECHGQMQKDAQGKVMHTALRQGSCTQCHDPHAGGKALLRQDVRSLCLSCHKGVEKELSAAHQNPPFAQGKCLSCHEAHYSKEPNLLKQSATTLCLSCHEPRCKARGVSVAALTRRMDCTGCHSPHASNVKGLLGAHGHKDFISGECSACHGQLEGGRFPLGKPERELCMGCHTKQASWFERSNQHIIDSQPCTRCHNPHASTAPAMLVTNEAALCFSCHADTARLMNGAEKTIRGKCEPIVKRQCSACHEPHASSSAVYLKAGPDHVCQKCHKREHRITHPLGAKAIDHRNRQPMQCISCHKMHGSTEQFMLYLDGKRALCIECHRY